MPGVASTSVLQLVHSKCANVSNPVSIDQDAVQRLAASLDPAEVRAAWRGNIFPVKFESQEAEVTFLALYHLLDFGSGYDPLLLAKNRRDAHEAIQFGLIGVHLGAQRLDKDWMLNFSNYSAHNYFGIEGMEEQEVMPGITMSKPGPLQPLVNAIRHTVNKAGEALERAGVETLGELILFEEEAANVTRQPPRVSELVDVLVDAIPGFSDSCSIGDDIVPLHRKAQQLAAGLHERFAAEDPGRFAFTDIDELSADSGNVVPAVLRHLGVLQYPPQLAEVVDAGQQLPAGPDECGIRAAAVAAVDEVVKAAGGGFSAYQLGCWLIAQTEDGKPLHGVDLHKHLTPDTTAY